MSQPKTGRTAAVCHKRRTEKAQDAFSRGTTSLIPSISGIRSQEDVSRTSKIEMVTQVAVACRPSTQRVEKRREAVSAGIIEPGAGTQNWTGFRRTIDRIRAAGDPGKGYKGNPSYQIGSERVTLMRQSLWRNDCRAYGGVPDDGNGICGVLELRSPSRPTG